MKNLNHVLIAITLFAARLTFAGGTSGVGSGGQTVDVDGRPTLRDLVDRSVCIWYPGPDIVEAQGHWPNIVASLERIAPVYGQFLRMQMNAVNFCVTEGSLVHIDARDSDGLTIWDQEGQQVAIRVGDQVYLDRRIFSRMDEVSRSYLMMHELMHGYLKSSAHQRNSKMRNFINFARRNETTPQSRASFLLQVKMNEIEWPSDELTLGEIAHLHELDQTALDPRSPLPERTKASLELYYFSVFAYADDTRHRLVGRNTLDVYIAAYEKERTKSLNLLFEANRRFCRALHTNDIAGVRAGVEEGLLPATVCAYEERDETIIATNFLVPRPHDSWNGVWLWEPLKRFGGQYEMLKELIKSPALDVADSGPILMLAAKDDQLVATKILLDHPRAPLNQQTFYQNYRYANLLEGVLDQAVSLEMMQLYANHPRVREKLNVPAILTTTQKDLEDTLCQVDTWNRRHNATRYAHESEKLKWILILNGQSATRCAAWAVRN